MFRAEPSTCKWSNSIFPGPWLQELTPRNGRNFGGGGVPNGLPTAGQVMAINRYIHRQSGSYRGMENLATGEIGLFTYPKL